MSSDGSAEVLSNERRRKVLAVLHEAEEPLALADLARDLLRQDTPTRPPDAEAIKRRYIRLYHCDIPKMAEAGLIDYDARSNTARYRGDEQGAHLTEEVEG